MTVACCYMCDLPGTTVEHVPPRSIFPESKDVGGQDYRKNLITVLSCPAHNNQKSQDDEFLMVSLAGIIGNIALVFSLVCCRYKQLPSVRLLFAICTGR